MDFIFSLPEQTIDREFWLLQRLSWRVLEPGGDF